MIAPGATPPISGPYAWWMSIPATTREPIKSFAVATGLTLTTVVTVLWGTYTTLPCVAPPCPEPSLHGFLAYLSTHWFYGLMGVLISGSFRGRQGYNKANATAPADPPPDPPLVGAK
jgi:hypothetical protein